MMLAQLPKVEAQLEEVESQLAEEDAQLAEVEGPVLTGPSTWASPNITSQKKY